MHFFYFKDSLKQLFPLNYQPQAFNNLMEFIRHQGYEDWGDCKGRAWCATCHIKVSSPEKLIEPNEDEKNRLSKLSNKLNNSRLACQIPLEKNIHEMEMEYIGDD